MENAEQSFNILEPRSGLLGQRFKKAAVGERLKRRKRRVESAKEKLFVVRYRRLFISSKLPEPRVLRFAGMPLGNSLAISCLMVSRRLPGLG